MTIGITGAFCDNNFGDYTMLLNDIYDFAKCTESLTKIIIFCYETELVEKLCVDYFSDFNIEIFHIETSLEIAEQNAYIGVDHTIECPTPMEILRNVKNISELREKVFSVDLMVSCGGGHFDYYWLGLKRRYRLFSLVAPCIIARQMSIPRIMMGHSFGPWGNNKEFFQNLFNYIEFDSINCRDNLYSKRYLQAISVTENVKEVCDDLAFINPKITGRKTNARFSNYYIIDIYSSIQDIEHNIERIVAFADRMKAERNLKPLFIPHGPGYNGTRQAELLKRYIPYIEIYMSKKGYLPPEDFISLLKGAEFVLCEHYHTFVLSTTNKVPAIMFVRKIDGSHYYYYNKTVGFLKISGVLAKSKIGEELFCTLSLPELFETESIISKINAIKQVLAGFDFGTGEKKLNYINEILKLAGWGNNRIVKTAFL